MKPATFIPGKKSGSLIAISFFIIVINSNHSVPEVASELPMERHISKDIAVKLTKFEVKEVYQEQFRKALSDYVFHSLAIESNIMAEAYYEQANPTIVWLIERWKNRTELYKSSARTKFKAIDSLAKSALVQPSKSYHVEDLEPLTKPQWRKTAKKEDNPLTVMLFVDSKSGTQEIFKDLYHNAMPQFRSEAGVITYQLSQLKEDATQFVTFEKFRNDEAFQYHLKFPPVKPIIDFLETNIENPPFQSGLHQLIEFAPLIRE
jgi:quinol monooxygenase YgiN